MLYFSFVVFITLRMRGLFTLLCVSYHFSPFQGSVGSSSFLTRAPEHL
jgi:hypothetical protein